MHRIPSTKQVLLFKVTLVVLLLLTFAGCRPVSTSPTSAAVTAVPTTADSIDTTAEMVPVEQITNLPTHAPTTTIETQTVATSIPASPEADGAGSQDNQESDFDILIGEDTAFGEAEVQIKRPGRLSRITSPFLAIAFVEPAPDRLVEVTLLGEDGRILDSKTVRAMEYLGMENGNMITELTFQIEGLSELGRLEVSVTDEFGRMKAYNSIDLILLSMGDTDRNYTPEVQERIIIQYPQPNYMVQGSTLLVSGLVRTDSEQPLQLTLIDENGQLVGEGSASVVLNEDQDFGIFIGEIPFEVGEAIWVRLSVAIPGKRIPGIEYIKTMEMVISP